MNHLEKMQDQARKRLPQDENLRYCVPGDYRQTDGVKTMIPMGIMAATEKRILYLTTGLVGFTMEEFPYESIAQISCSKGPKGYTMTISSLSSKASLKWSMLGDVTELVAFARKHIRWVEQSGEEKDQPAWNKISLPPLKNGGAGQEIIFRKPKGGRI